MMSNKVPNSILKDIQRTQRQFIWGDTNGRKHMHTRQFIWGDTDGRKHMHTVRQKKIATVKEEGGLGLMDLISMNKACVSKLGWNFRYGDKALWSDVLRDKYGRSNTAVGKLEAKAQESSLWKNMTQVKDLINRMGC